MDRTLVTLGDWAGRREESGVLLTQLSELPVDLSHPHLQQWTSKSRPVVFQHALVGIQPDTGCTETTVQPANILPAQSPRRHKVLVGQARIIVKIPPGQRERVGQLVV